MGYSKININMEFNGKKTIQKYIDQKIDMQEFARKILTKLMEMYGLDRYMINLLIVGPSEIRRINKQYRNIDKVTDVLSFPMFNREQIQDVLSKKYLPNNIEIFGDIVINPMRIYDQSIRYNTGLKREFSYMLVHSFCHILGYDHIIEEEKKEMRKKEEELLSKIFS